MARIFEALKTFAVIAFASVCWLAISSQAKAANRTWDGGGADSNWTNPINWDGNLTAPVASDALIFGGTVRLTPNNDNAADTAFGPITFNAGSGAFVLGGNRILLSGDINDNATAAQKIALELGLESSTSNINVASGGSLALGAVTFGLAAQSPNISTLNINNTVSATAVTVQTLNAVASPNVITIAAGQSFNVSDVFRVGTNATTSTAVPTALNVTGGGTLNISPTNNANFILGVGSGNNAFATMNVTMDMSGLSSFVYNTGASGTGNMYIGFGTRPGATLRLANTSNTITAATIEIGNSNQTPGFTSLGTNNNTGGPSTLALGAGTNVINASTINMGFNKGVGIINFQDPVNGSVVIAGQTGGTSKTNFTVGRQSSGTGTTNVTSMQLAGHTATVQAGTFIVGSNAGSGGTASIGVASFDTGTFTADSFQIGVHSSGTGPAIGAFILGAPYTTTGSGATISFGATPNPSATGVLTVNNTFNLGNQTTNNSLAGSAPTAATFGVYGGTANINADMLDASTVGTRNTTLTVDGGTLSIGGHSIGSAASPLTTVNLNSGTLSNAATIAAKTINIQPAITITGAPSFILADGGTLTSSLPTPLTLASGGGISGGGASGATVTGDIAAGTGSKIAPGNASTAATMQFSNNLSFSNNSTAAFKLSENAGSGNDQINASGNLSLAGTVNVALSAIGLGPQVGNTYTLFNYSGSLTGNQSNIAIQDPKTRETFTIVPTATTPGSIQLSVSGAGPANLTWIGNNGNNWDLITTANFRDAAQTAQKFFNQDAVTFDNTSINTNDIQLVGNLAPSTITVNATRNYKFAGTGSISGGGTLTKSGTGTLVVATNNTYSGGTTINLGTVQVGDGGTSGSLGTGPISNEGTLVFNRSDAVTVSNAISGSAGPVRQEGTGVVTLTGNNSFFGGLIVNNGTLRLGSATAAGTGTTTVNAGGTLVAGGGAQSSPMTMNGGTLGSGFGATQTSITTADFTINPSTVATIYTADPQSLATNAEVVLAGTGTLRGSGNINVLSGTNATNPDGSTGFRLQGTNPSDYSGTITIGHNVKGELQTTSVGPQSPAGTGKIVVTAGDAALGGTTNAVTLTGGYSELNLRNNSPGDTTIGNDVQIVGSGLAILNPLTSSTPSAPANTIVNMGNLKIGAGQELGVYLASGNSRVVTFQSVSLSGTARFSPKTPGFGAATAVGSDLALNNVTETVAGSGVTMAGLRTLYLNGTNTYTGPTQVLSGTLGGTGSVVSPVTVSAGAAIAPGTSAVAVGTFSAPSVALSGALNIDLDESSTGIQDVLNVTNALTLSNAAVSFTVANNQATQPAYVFAHYGTLTGTPFTSFTGIPDGYTINYNYQNLKEIALVPLMTPLKLGDFNFDGHVNGADVTAMLAALTDLNKFEANNTLTPARLLTIGDLDGSGAVNNADLQGLLTLLKNGGGSVAAVPEPASVLLAAVGLLGLASVRRGRKRN